MVVVVVIVVVVVVRYWRSTETGVNQKDWAGNGGGVECERFKDWKVYQGSFPDHGHTPFFFSQSIYLRLLQVLYEL